MAPVGGHVYGQQLTRSLSLAHYLEQWPNLPPTTKPSTFIILLLYTAYTTLSAKQPFLLYLTL